MNLIMCNVRSVIMLITKYQYGIFSPFDSISTRLAIENTKFSKESGVNVCHSIRIASCKSVRLLKTLFDNLCLSTPQIFSIGFKSGEYPGQSNNCRF